MTILCWIFIDRDRIFVLRTKKDSAFIIIFFVLMDRIPQIGCLNRLDWVEKPGEGTFSGIPYKLFFRNFLSFSLLLLFLSFIFVDTFFRFNKLGSFDTNGAFVWGRLIKSCH